MSGEVLLSATGSVCPECLQKIKAVRVMLGDTVFLRKECPEHGSFQTPIWRGDPFFGFWQRPKTPSYPKSPLTTVQKGCPWDCGLCPEHRQHTCTALMEVTQRCNLKCAYCFADAGGGGVPDPDLDTLRRWFQGIPAAEVPCNIQLSGGEPTLRDDLPEIASLGRSLGFPFIQVNTNGVRLAADRSYVKALKDGGVASIFLQFDGVEDATYQRLRGRALFREKVRAVEHCVEEGLGVVLVPTLVPGVNIHEIGAIIGFAVDHMPAVRGVHFQPVSYFGRYPTAPPDEARITLPEVIRAIEAQTEGRLKASFFQPPGCENALCSFHGNFVLLPDGELKAWSSYDPRRCCSEPESAEIGAEKARRFVSRSWSQAPHPEKSPEGPSLGGWDDFLHRVQTYSLCISAMAFQDAWNLDLERLRDCCIHVVAPEGGLIPFCAYNLTDSRGRSFYRSICTKD
ncbi:radical SAM (seleno)protein TrsS [Desulforhabdus sp. TSK]|uniref:radical SAM (seleno)protein TrsS n=1 Tax=Desulforhabdus sp. TSK TaxID=2925014 RepID=UPI001FC7C43C|nr:radical SAM (seleno)protein TrsS [Desulforhabdus sp. TSK]GKT08485.1 radical SAM protein [Desulforhabdus sp. TSK]